MPSRNYELLKQAIENRQVVEAEYNGWRRKMCPHVVGLASDGSEQALFYQFDGNTSGGSIGINSPKNWKCMKVAGLANLRVVEDNEEWHTSLDHYKEQTCVKKADVGIGYKNGVRFDGDRLKV